MLSNSFPMVDGQFKGPSGVTDKSASSLDGMQWSADEFKVTFAASAEAPEFKGNLRLLLTGESVAMVIRNFLPKASCNALAEQFDRTSTHDRDDDVSAIEVGSGHYKRSIPDYLQRCANERPLLQKIWDQSKVDLPAALACIVKNTLRTGQQYRIAQHLGHAALPLRFASWKGGAKVALKAHDDLAQLNGLLQYGFEIQEVMCPVAFNCYVRVPRQGGQLRCWNIQPSRATKAKLGIEHSGYPYDAEVLTGIDYFDINVQQGDLVLLNGRHVHSVLGWEGEAWERIVVNGFIGLTRDGQVVLSWT